MKKETLLLSGLTLVLGLLLCGCKAVETETPTVSLQPTTPAGAEPTEAPPSVEPVLLTIGGLHDADCWNPYVCTATYIWGQIIMHGFATYGVSSEACPAQPGLAESWEVSEDGKTWTINLFEGLTYSDGTPITAQTIKEFMDYQSSNPALGSWFLESANLVSVEVIDELILQYTTSVPMIHSPDAVWAVWFMHPPHLWTDLDEVEVFTYDFYPPVGAGPYELIEHVPGSHMIFEAREEYHLGKPPIDRVVYRIYTNADALVSALIVGEIDLTTPLLPPESVQALEGISNITVEKKFPGDTYDLVFNMADYGTGHPAIKDPNVRLAIDYAIDKQQLVDIALLGEGIVCPTNWACGPNFEDLLNPDLEVTPYDPVEAGRILDESGYADADSDGIRETPEGLPLEFGLYYATDFPAELTIAQMVADWLGAIGIQVNVEAVDWGTWFYQVSDQHDFDMAIDLRTPETNPSAMDFWLGCWAAEPGPFTFNAPGYCNEEMDEAVFGYIYSNDPEAGKASIFEAQRILNQDRPMIVLAGPLQIQAYRNDRFEFPFDTCYADISGMYGYQGLMNAEVK
jgi:peptide/nickel transport system substrate-binding protein